MKVLAVFLCTFLVAFGATVQPIDEEHLKNRFENILLDNLAEYLGLQIKMIKGVQKIQLLLGNVEKILEEGLTDNTHIENPGVTIPDQNDDEDPIVSRTDDFESTLLDYLGAYQELQIRLNTGIEKLQLSLGNVETILENEFNHDPFPEAELKTLTKPNKAKDSAKQPRNGKKVSTNKA
ncbi:uncharacterized protein LOC133530299 [Cydia pomonella]|uniref:uncharacterized protein LOC133530299 n=1 Tax=Cydia pomonella TaxID=82600 RepID=UPI002ADE1D85|nr:uncharacterized protein LOC133530299 [Cydia pomonella]